MISRGKSVNSRFVLAKLQEKGLKPVADASKRTLIRLRSDGLPPTPAEIQAFLDDKSPPAYAQLVDRLLASKSYGEHWGRMWLDVVRYADSGSGDFPVPQVYKYRDDVIQSFNDDTPYDRFIREQLAGDLLPRNRSLNTGGTSWPRLRGEHGSRGREIRLSFRRRR
jgi:hypothetical protein